MGVVRGGSYPMGVFMVGIFRCVGIVRVESCPGKWTNLVSFMKYLRKCVNSLELQ